MVRMSYTCLLTNVCVHDSFYPWVRITFSTLNRTQKFTITDNSDSLSALEGHARLVLNGPNRAANLWSRDRSRKLIGFHNGPLEHALLFPFLASDLLWISIEFTVPWDTVV